jgi:signal transduction histidine kinase
MTAGPPSSLSAVRADAHQAIGAAAGSLDPKLAMVFAMLIEAALAGAPCPTNLEIEDALAVGSTSLGARKLALLEQRGLIRVERWQRARRVTIVATGWQTAAPPGEGAMPPRHVERGASEAGNLLAQLRDVAHEIERLDSEPAQLAELEQRLLLLLARVARRRARVARRL